MMLALGCKYFKIQIITLSFTLLLKKKYIYVYKSRELDGCFKKDNLEFT